MHPRSLSLFGILVSLAAPVVAQQPSVVDLTPTVPPDVPWPQLANDSGAVSGPGTVFANTGSGRGQALADILGPDPNDPGNPGLVGPPDGILDLIQVNSNSPPLPLGAAPGEEIVAGVGNVHFACVVYRGSDDGRFTDVTDAVMPGDPDGFDIKYPCGSPWGVVAGDYDGDGDIDLYFPCGGFNLDSPNTLLGNNGDGTFTNVSALLGFSAVQASFCATSIDFDRDGDLDIYEANGSAVLPTFWGGSPQPDAVARLFENNFNSFPDVAATAGVDLRGNGFSCTTSDLDLDGWPDLVLSCFRQWNKLFYSNGDGTFNFMLPASSPLSNFTMESALEPDPAFPGTEDFGTLPPQLAGLLPFQPFWSMPVDAEDFNGDGWPDLMLSAWSQQLPDGNDQSAEGAFFLPWDSSRLFINRGDQDGDGVGDGLFRDVTDDVGIGHIGGCMGHIAGDFNGDGFMDMYLGGGGPQLGAHLEEDYLYINNGPSWPEDFQADPDQPLGQVFYEVGALAGTYANNYMAHGLTSYTNDLGRTDILVGNGGPALFNDGQANVYYRNVANDDGSTPGTLRVALEPDVSPPGAYGAKIEVIRDGASDLGRTLLRERRSGVAFSSHNDAPLAFGMDDAGALFVNVDWPSGIQQGRFLWLEQNTQAESIVLAEPELSLGMSFHVPPGGDLRAVVNIEQTGANPVATQMLFLSLFETGGFFVPLLFINVVPLLIVEPDMPLEFVADLPMLPRSLYLVALAEFGTSNVLAVRGVWHDPDNLPSPPAESSEESSEESEGVSPLARVARRHLGLYGRLELQAESIRIAPAANPIEWQTTELTGTGTRDLARGASLNWKGERVWIEFREPGVASLVFQDDGPILVVGGSMSCCDAAAEGPSQLVSFDGIQGRLHADGVAYSRAGVRESVAASVPTSHPK